MTVLVCFIVEFVIDQIKSNGSGSALFINLEWMVFVGCLSIWYGYSFVFGKMQEKCTELQEKNH